MVAAMVFSTMPMTLRELIEERQVDVAELVERGQLDHRLDLAFEQHRQHHDAERRRFAQAGADLDVIVRHVGDQDALLLQRALAHQPFAQLELVARRSCRSSIGVAGEQLQQRLLAVLRVVDIEDALLRAHQRREFGEQQLATRSAGRAAPAPCR